MENFIDTCEMKDGIKIDIFKCSCDFLVGVKSGVFLQFTLYCPMCEQEFMAIKQSTKTQD